MKVVAAIKKTNDTSEEITFEDFKWSDPQIPAVVKIKAATLLAITPIIGFIMFLCLIFLWPVILLKMWASALWPNDPSSPTPRLDIPIEN